MIRLSLMLLLLILVLKPPRLKLRRRRLISQPLNLLNGLALMILRLVKIRLKRLIMVLSSLPLKLIQRLLILPISVLVVKIVLNRLSMKALALALTVFFGTLVVLSRMLVLSLIHLSEVFPVRKNFKSHSNYRRPMSRKGSKKYFSATASKTNIKNLQAVPMRGGFRL